MVKAPADRAIPKGPLMKKRCMDVGQERQWIDLRERYKREGLTPRDAAVRSYVELGIAEKWDDWNRRRTLQAIVGSTVPLTPSETKKATPSYTPPSVTKGSDVGEAVLSLPEQIRWVKQRLAMVRNGGEPPQSYPNADVLYWYQIAITRPADFDKIVLKIESPQTDGDDVIARDGEHQFREIESQIEEALKEVGKQLGEYEQAFSETLDELLPAGAEGPGVEPAVPA